MIKRRIIKMEQKEIDKINAENIKMAREEYERFLNQFNQNKCYICGRNLSSFNENNPCLHWFLSPPGTKKKFFDKLFDKFDLFQINSYLMWVSYQENNSTNINNLSLERDQNKLWEITIKYKNLRWSITCSQTDFTGHERTNHNFPHYHFLMQVDEKPFISFDDFHIALSDLDRLKIKTHNKSSGNFVHSWYVPGMEEIFKLNPKEIVKGLKIAEDETSAPFHVMSMIEMDGGIPGEEIDKAFKKCKETGDSFAKYFSEFPKAKCKIIIEPGEGVPKLDRKLSRGKKRN